MDTTKIPAGNGTVGDKAFIRFAELRPDDQKAGEGPSWRAGPWRTGELIEVGLPNEFGYLLNGRVRLDDTGEELVLRHTHHYFCDPKDPQVILVPGNLPAEFPELCRRFYDEHGQSRYGAMIVRDTGNRDDNRYSLWCDRCMNPILMQIETVETAELTIDAPGAGVAIDEDEMIVWESSKPGTDDSGRTLRCECGRDWSDLDEAEEILENVEDYC
jgi:hypothetical protein